MSTFPETITIQLTLTAFGDALIYGFMADQDYVPGAYLKQLVFAWHEASFYGTDLDIQRISGVDLIMLPADQVIPFFAEVPLLSHVNWNFGEGASELRELAPLLSSYVQEKKYIPSFMAFQEGKRMWTWDKDAIDPQEQSVNQQRMQNLALNEGLEAAFSANVEATYYSSEETTADLRREFPILFATDRKKFHGYNEKSWLITMGWKADISPFRPLLQLLEPDEEVADWRLQLMLQDKQDSAQLIHVRLSTDGQVSGVWPEEWASSIHERAGGWSEHLLTILPSQPEPKEAKDILSSPLSDAAAWQFLTTDSQRLLEAGWQVLLPAWWETASRKKTRLRAKVRSAEDGATKGNESLFGLHSLVNFDWRIAIGDTDLTEEEFHALLARNERLVRFRGQWITLDPALLAQIRQIMEGIDPAEGLSFQDILQLHLLGAEDSSSNVSLEQAEEEQTRIQLEVELNDHLNEIMAQLQQQAAWPALPVPTALQADLRPYQRDGFTWLAFLRRFGLGACLADDMGLGKTVQFITYLLHVKESTQEQNTHFPSLLICPTSVLGNWQKELQRFAPSLRVMLHYGGSRRTGNRFEEEALSADILLTSYGTATLDQELLQSYTWESICLDEAQNIKNAQTKQSAAVRSFPAKHRIAMTGTPIENRLSELWSLYDFMNPGYLGTSRGFNHRFITAIEKEHNEQRTQDLQRLVKPFMLRRKKKDPAIQLDLPDKNEMKTYIHLTAEQGALYDQTVNELMKRMQELEGIERKGAILSALTRLKQLCDHPVLLTKESMPQNRNTGELDTESLIPRSAKLERLLAMVRELRDEGERCLIFTQYIGMGEMLQQVLQHELQEPVLYLNGSSSKTARDRMIEQFQSQTLHASEQPSIFILSIKAGGVGLNLTAANHVFHFDRWWNPAVENQATDRAYRMGQTKDVQVHKFISLGTLEERIDEMLENKQQLSDNVISSTEGWITELSTEELQDLFMMRKDWTG
ncbi:SNF2 family DNA or RNA helicase [Paenibacillus shirakamiensis]|uniref:SNF2 family DNA or RNA helicase n=1 Tax=Paenibacillus shirakamiensis TaxID=1265935 RepID=A0ABS4JGB0_9BACL|nr:DEAD/DEAH box helicase [Paenibacillus shirakamiensis]MBP2000760.1 SNF2 family DNA or RNA helicase [Paenibacillus shirakamiensis]